MSLSQSPLSHSIPVTNVSGQGKVVRVVATDEERRAIADDCGLAELKCLEADFTVTKGAGRLLAVQGHISAEVVQACGVTLKPVEEQVEAEIALSYTLDPKWAEMPEVVVNPDDEDPPEPVIDGEIDFGVIALEHFALNLNPYPRAAGADFDAAAWAAEARDNDQSEKRNPFAVLERIKRPVNDP